MLDWQDLVLVWRRPTRPAFQWVKKRGVGLVLTTPRGTPFTPYKAPTRGHEMLGVFLAYRPTPESFAGFADSYGDLADRPLTFEQWQGRHKRLADYSRLQAYQPVVPDDPSHERRVASLNSEVRRGAAISLQPDPERRKFKVVIALRDLWTELCVQLALTLGDSDFTFDCPWCDEPLHDGMYLRRIDTKACSPRCRMRAYRTRRAAARRLGAQGKDIQDIAGELGSEIETVRKWLSKKKGT